jgi:hypothetical protein
MKYYFINTDRKAIDYVLKKVGSERFYDALEETGFNKRDGLGNYRLKSEEDSLYFYVQIHYPSGWYDLLKVNAMQAPKEHWEIISKY